MSVAFLERETLFRALASFSSFSSFFFLLLLLFFFFRFALCPLAPRCSTSPASFSSLHKFTHPSLALRRQAWRALVALFAVSFAFKSAFCRRVNSLNSITHLPFRRKLRAFSRFFQFRYSPACLLACLPACLSVGFTTASRFRNVKSSQSPAADDNLRDFLRSFRARSI